jgi:microcystin-dependent protein
VVKAGSGARVTGAGSQANPYVIETTGEGGGGTGFVPGMISAFGGSVAPAGWLVANGQAVSRTAYSALFAAIGVVYGVGDNSTTFNVPDLAGTFPLGADGSHAIGSKGGAEQATINSGHLPLHNHTINHGHGLSLSGSVGGGNIGGPQESYASVPTAYYDGIDWSLPAGGGGFGGRVMIYNNAPIAPHTHGLSLSGSVVAHSGNSGSAGTSTPTPIPTMPPYLSVTFIIKT